MSDTKLSQINSGGTSAMVPATDQIVIVRSGSTDLLASAAIPPTIVAVSATTKPLGLTDANTIQDCSNASAQTITIPLNATVEFPNGTVIVFEQNGVGSVTVVGGSGVTVNGVNTGSITTGSQFSGMYARKESIDTWYIEAGTLPVLTGDVTTVGTVSTVAKISGVAVGTPTGTGNVVFSTSPTITGLLYLNSGTAEEDVFSNGNSGTSKTIVLDNGNFQSVTITGAVTLGLTAPTHPCKITLVATQDGSGHVYSIGGAIKWPGGTPPSYSTVASKIDVFSIIYDGTSFYGMGGIAFT